jgi:4-amino-4-deoxy-L-arabinose transferase-like glycosyltransferase
MTARVHGAGEEDRGRPLARLAVAVVLVGAVLIAAQVYSLAVVRAPGPDDSLYASEAARWLAAQPLTTMTGEPAAARPPIYVMALAAATAVTGDWESAERIVATLIAFVAVLAAAAIAWSITGAGAAILSVGVFAVPGMADAFARSGIDGLQAVFILSSIAVAMLFAGRMGSWSAAGAAAVGCGLGLAVLTKETALALAPWPLLWAAGQPTAVLRPSLRWAGIASAVLTLTILPWWLWVYQAHGTLFPTGFVGLRAAAGVGAIAIVGLLPLLLVSDRVNQRAVGLLEKIGERARWWLAIAFSAAWAALIVLAFLFSDVRYALPRFPSPEDILESTARLLGLLLFPAGAIAAGIVALAIASCRPILRGLLLVQMLTAALVVIIVLKGWDPRSALIPAISVGLLVPIAAAAAIQRFSVSPSLRVQRAGVILVLAAVVGVSSLNLVGLVRAAQIPPTFTEAQRWNGQIVHEAADWLSTRLEPGETVVASWLFATSLDAITGARYRIVESPTLQVRVGRPREPILVPTGTLFRENAKLPPVPPEDWLFLRRHPSEGYLVALSGQLLGDAIRTSGTRFVVLTGEHPAQSTATIATSLLLWPGVSEAARFTKEDADIVILEIDQRAFSVGPFPTQLNTAMLRDWPGFVRSAGRGVDAGAALCELLAGRSLEIVPNDDRGKALVARYLPSGCPVATP